MDYKDYYHIMGLARDVSQDDIKRQYRKLARKYHPDVSKEPQAEFKFKELGEAYEVLKDPEKRAKYDHYGQESPSNNTQYQSTSTNQSSANNNEDFEAFINSIYQQRQQQDNSFNNLHLDVHAKLNISLYDSFIGAEKTIQRQRPTRTNTGEVSYQLQAIKVTIPSGITDKQHIRLKGQGNQYAGQKGDLYIEIALDPHPWFNVDNKTIYLQLPITAGEATLGASVSVPTLGGIVKLTIPKLSQTGTKLRLKGRGLPGKPAGDQVITLQIVIDTEENTHVAKLYEQIAASRYFNPRKKLGVSNDKQ